MEACHGGEGGRLRADVKPSYCLALLAAYRSGYKAVSQSPTCLPPSLMIIDQLSVCKQVPINVLLL